MLKQDFGWGNMDISELLAAITYWLINLQIALYLAKLKITGDLNLT